jgi:hypothetical protein
LGEHSLRHEEKEEDADEGEEAPHGMSKPHAQLRDPQSAQAQPGRSVQFRLQARCPPPSGLCGSWTALWHSASGEQSWSPLGQGSPVSEQTAPFPRSHSSPASRIPFPQTPPEGGGEGGGVVAEGAGAGVGPGAAAGGGGRPREVWQHSVHPCLSVPEGKHSRRPLSSTKQVSPSAAHSLQSSLVQRSHAAEGEQHSVQPGKLLPASMHWTAPVVWTKQPKPLLPQYPQREEQASQSALHCDSPVTPSGHAHVPSEQHSASPMRQRGLGEGH